MEILKLVPAYKNYIWGGEKLAERYGKKADSLPLRTLNLARERLWTMRFSSGSGIGRGWK